MAFQLVMKNGPAPGKIYSLEKSEISIGREAGSDVFVNDVEVSRQHARLTDQAGNYILEDLGSTNGTYINDELVGNTEFPTTVPILFGIEGLSCGYDFGEAVSHEYHAPFTFTGTLHQVTVDLGGELIVDDESTVRRLIAQQ